MKGLAVETILYGIILVIAIVIISVVIIKLVPTFGSFMEATMKGVKESLCGLFGFAGKLLGC